MIFKSKEAGRIIAIILISCILYFLLFILSHIIYIVSKSSNISMQLLNHILSNNSKNPIYAYLELVMKFFDEYNQFISRILFSGYVVSFVVFVFTVLVMILLVSYCFYIIALALKKIWPIGCILYGLIMKVPIMYSLKEVGIFAMIDSGLGWIVDAIGGREKNNERDKELSNSVAYFFHENYMKHLKEHNRPIYDLIQSSNAKTEGAANIILKAFCGEDFSEEQFDKNEPANRMFTHPATKRKKIISGTY